MKIEEQKLLNSQMANWVKELTRWPHRKTGTYEGRKSAEYVEKEFKKRYNSLEKKGSVSK